MQVFTLRQLRQDLDEVLQPPKVAVLPIPFYPGYVVLKDLSLWQWGGFPKVNHPDFGLFFLVVDEEEGTPNYLRQEKIKRGLSHRIRRNAISIRPVHFGT